MIRARPAPAARTGRAVRLSSWLPGTMWAREWLLALRRPRALAVRTAVPLLLAWPLVAGRAPSFWAGMLLTVLVAMVGAVGTGVAMERARREGLLDRVALLPRRPDRVLGEWVVAAAGIDLVQLTPALLVVTLAAPGGGAVDAAVLLLAVVSVLLLVNVVGCVVSLVAGGTGEVLVDVGVVVAPLLYLGGLFTGVPHDGWRGWVAGADPFAGLHSAFVAALGGTPSLGTEHVAFLAVATALAAAAVLRGLAGPLLRATVR